VKFQESFVSLPNGTDPMSLELDEAIILIKQKQKADAPIYKYKNLPVVKGKGRFGPFIKWNNMFINVNKKYDWDDLSDNDIEELIEDKLQKEKDKLIHDWKEEGIKVEKARWGRHTVTKGKTKVELDKFVDVTKMTLEEAIKLVDSKTPKKKAATKKVTKKKTSKK
jgi:DNA topoisomerase-1